MTSSCMWNQQPVPNLHMSLDHLQSCGRIYRPSSKHHRVDGGGPYSFFLLASHVCHHAHNGHHFVFTITFWQHVCIRSQSHRKDLAVKTVFQTPLCSSLHRPHVVPLLQIDNIQRQQSYLLRKKANMILGKAVRKRCRKSSDSTSATASHIYRVNSAV